MEMQGKASNNGGRKGSMISREEMTAMLGGGFSEALLRSTTTNSSKTTSKLTGRNGKPDFSSMTTQETAAFLKQQQEKNHASGSQSTKGLAPHRHRQHRSNKVREYQLLAHESSTATGQSNESVSRRDDADHKVLPSKQENLENEKGRASDDSSTSSNEWESSKRRHRNERHRPREQETAMQRRRPRVDSSSSESSNSDVDSLGNHRQNRNDVTAQGRRQYHDSSDGDSESDTETDQRRQRILQQRRLKQNQNLNDSKFGHAESHAVEKKEAVSEIEKPSDAPLPSTLSPKRIDKEENEARVGASAESSSSDNGSSESSSSSDSSSEEEEVPVKAKRPVFVPRHLRGLRNTIEKEEHDEEERWKKEQERQAKRVQESRALVQQVVSAKAPLSGDNNAPRDIDQTETVVTDDEEELNSKEAIDAWEVRELVRLLQDWELEQEMKQQERELRRRRNMTEEEKFQEDVATGRYQQPGQNRKRPLNGEGTQSNSISQQHGKRYYHRGAFYMDDEEWQGADDVRHRAGDYARAATESDRAATANMPQIMKQSKAGQFGRANQSKWRGLKAEDTTDRSSHMLLLPQQQKHRQRRDNQG